MSSKHIINNDPLILPTGQVTHQQSSPPHRKTYIVKSLTVILGLTVAVLVINYYLISNCPKDNSENLLMQHQQFHDHNNNDKIITVSVYYEILCPDSKHFILKQLVPAYAKYSAFLKLRMIPFGKGNVFDAGQHAYKFTCQHGPEECHGNKLHACVVQEFSGNQTLQLQIIGCSMERFRLWGSTTGQITDVVKECREKYAGSNSDNNNNNKVMCDNADELLAQAGHETLGLKPSVTFIPTIGIDGSLSNQRQILRDLKTVICEILRDQKALKIEC